jgi:hypothetical protein
MKRNELRWNNVTTNSELLKGKITYTAAANQSRSVLFIDLSVLTIHLFALLPSNKGQTAGLTRHDLRTIQSRIR